MKKLAALERVALSCGHHGWRKQACRNRGVLEDAKVAAEKIVSRPRAARGWQHGHFSEQASGLQQRQRQRRCSAGCEAIKEVELQCLINE